ncbi:MAG: Gfo/Idh/MocA family protein [Gemmatimonadales bacterium]
MRPSPPGGTSRPPIRIAVIGLGAIAQRAHLPVLAKMRGAQIVALCDNDLGKARSLAQRFGVPDTFDDIDDLLEGARLDAAVVATPNHLHEPHALSALRAGVHVMIERPFALTSRGVERILAAAKGAGRKVFIANNHRFRAEVQTLHSFIQGGELGRIHSVRAGAYRVRSTVSAWRLRRAEAGGGAFLELGLPLLDLAAWVADVPEPVQLSATQDRSRGGNDVEDSLFVLAQGANGFTLTIDVNWSYVGDDDRWWFEVLGTLGSARLAPLRIVKELNGVPTDVSPSGASQRESAFVQSYRAELAHFLAVLRDSAVYEAPDDQVRVYRVVESIYRAAGEGKELSP